MNTFFVNVKIIFNMPIKSTTGFLHLIKIVQNKRTKVNFHVPSLIWDPPDGKQLESDKESLDRGFWEMESRESVNSKGRDGGPSSGACGHSSWRS